MADDDFETKRAAFNMALNTLERIGKILDEIKMVSSLPNIDDSTQQKAKLKLLKQLLVQASPLLPKKFMKENKDEILNLKMVTRTLMENRTMGGRRNLGTRTFFSEGTESKIDRYIIDIQLSLQEEGYFMPPAEDDDFF